MAKTCNYAVITAKNEAATIGDIVERLRLQGFRVIVVDDGSGDATGTTAAAAGATVITHKANQGIGPSLQEAWRMALALCADRVVQLDAGGSHVPEEAWFLCDKLDDCDMVIGSRFTPGGRYVGRGWRALSSRLTAFLMSKATHSHIADWTSGYRAFTRHGLNVLLRHTYFETMHAWQIEVLGHALRDKLTIVEMPITYTAGGSSLRWYHIHGAVMQFLWWFFR